MSSVIKNDNAEIIDIGGKSDGTISLPLKLTKVEYNQDYKFIRPTSPNYSVGGSIASICSLTFMTVFSTFMFLYFTGNTSNLNLSAIGLPVITSALAPWAWMPFLFTIVGAAVGALFEFYLLVTGTPFQQTRSRATTFIRNIRLLNLAPVALTIFYAVCCMVITDPSLRLGALYFAGFIGCGLAVALFYSGAPNAVTITLLGLQAFQVILVLANYSTSQASLTVSSLLVWQAIFQTIAFIITASTPLRSTWFHITSTLSGVLLFAAVVMMNTTYDNFTFAVTPGLQANSLLFWGLVITCVLGIIATCKCFPRVYNNFRTIVSNKVWSVLYFVLVSAKRFPKPYNLTTVYAKNPPKPIALQPYSKQHPEFIPAGLRIPSAESLEGNVSIFYQLVTRTKKIFALIAILDHFFPQSDIKTPISEKPRVETWSDGTKYWPKLFLKTIFGFSIPGKTLTKAPLAALNNYKNGQLLAYLAESGVASPFLKAAPNSHPGMLTINLRHLEHLETKPDYSSYGGVAYFQVNKKEKRLELVSIVAPCTNKEVKADPTCPEFRQAEDLFIASMYYQVISGKHLTEIHMTYNLVEVSLHNSFDINGQWNHPIRTMLYLHLFSHELAEEITTEHLIQKGAIFNQIFATNYDGLISHLNNTYSDFDYGDDENFEERVKLLSTNNTSDFNKADILPNACIKWELEYAKIWRSYAQKIVDSVYAKDSDVLADEYLQCFHQNLLKVIVKGIPARYEGFATKKGLVRYLVDTIHHLVIRHQVYGTTAARAVMDPRISKVQVPKDMGNTGIDEWRSLAYVALATGRARFTLLMDDYTYLLDGVDSKYKGPMNEAFNALQVDLKALEEKWNSTAEEKSFNEEYFRAIPSSLHTGPGY